MERATPELGRAEKAPGGVAGRLTLAFDALKEKFAPSHHYLTEAACRFSLEGSGDDEELPSRHYVIDSLGFHSRSAAANPFPSPECRPGSIAVLYFTNSSPAAGCRSDCYGI